MKMLSSSRNPPRSFLPSRQGLVAWESIENLRSAGSLREISATLTRYCSTTGFDNFGFALRAQSTSTGGYVEMLDFPDEWAQRYKALSTATASSDDPVIQHVTKAVVPTTWDCKGRVSFTEPSIAKRARGLLGAAGEHNLRSGMTIPLFSPGVAWSFLVLTSQGTDHAADLLLDLPWACLIAQSVMQAVRQLAFGKDPATPELTSREREVLRWCAAGKTSWEMSRILSISEATVNFHLSNAAKKLGTAGRRATCLASISRGLLDL